MRQYIYGVFMIIVAAVIVTILSWFGVESYIDTDAKFIDWFVVWTVLYCFTSVASDD